MLEENCFASAQNASKIGPAGGAYSALQNRRFMAEGREESGGKGR